MQLLNWPVKPHGDFYVLEDIMKKIIVLILVFLAVSTIYAQTPISSNRIAGSNIVLNNLSKNDVDKIMQGTIFDVFTLDLKPNDYNTDLKKFAFLETDKGKEYQERLEGLKTRLNNQGIRTIQRQTGQTTRDTVCSISNYDVNRSGFTITLHGGGTQPAFASRFIPRINGFEIPGLKFSADSIYEYYAQIFIPVLVSAAQRIEGNRKISVQLQLSVDSFAIQKVFLINEDTNEVYAETDY